MGEKLKERFMQKIRKKEQEEHAKLEEEKRLKAMSELASRKKKGGNRH